MTVRELIDALNEFPPDMEVEAVSYSEISVPIDKLEVKTVDGFGSEPKTVVIVG
jgi:hypothetical protein